VDRHSVIERDNSKVTIADVGDTRPESISVVVLALDANRILDNGDAPFSPQIRPLRRATFSKYSVNW
jgi:hypothetical protein